MPLQTSGPISLNEIHIEAGGTTGTTASINDADIRGLISKTSGALMSFSEWYGASAVTYWDTTMTVGVFQFKSNPPIYGYADAAGYGSLDDDTVDNMNDEFCSVLNWNDSDDSLTLIVETTDVTDVRGNTEFTTLTIGGVDFSNSSATYTFTSEVSRTWEWSSVTNPFGTTSGATRSIVMS